MRPDADRPHAGAASAVGDGPSLVQVVVDGVGLPGSDGHESTLLDEIAGHKGKYEGCAKLWFVEGRTGIEIALASLGEKLFLGDFEKRAPPVGIAESSEDLDLLAPLPLLGELRLKININNFY